jgi:hypothetical protein
MHIRTATAAAALLLLVVGCGGDDGATSAPRTTPSSVTATSQPTSTSTSTSPTTVRLEQPAVWPAAEVSFATPEAAARDFVTHALGVPPVLGDFQQGDGRSGEIPVLAPSGGDSRQIVRSILLLRQLGPHDGWFVLAAVQDQTSILEPAARAEVAAGPVVVRGQGRGFEGNLVVVAMRPGQGRPLDRAVTSGGSGASPEPFAVTIDLSTARPGETVLLMVRGGTGREEDPGEYSALPVTIAG